MNETENDSSLPARRTARARAAKVEANLQLETETKERWVGS
jgi:hypothetical protein